MSSLFDALPGLVRRTVAASLAIALTDCGLRAADAPPKAGSPARPNVVLIVTDDQGYGDVSSYWNTDLQTPFLDEIGRNGVRFTQFRVAPLCAPTRSMIMTGLDSLAAGMWRGPGESARGKAPEGGWPADERRIKDDIILLPQLLKKAGYATGIFGKWHLGYDDANVPNARGFDQFVGFLGGAHPYWLRANHRIEENGQPLKYEGHTTDLFADRAIQFIRTNRDKPFFCYLPFNAVHGPLRNAEREADSAKPEWLAYYEKRGVAQPRRDYNAIMSHADARIGDVLKTLREIGVEKNTLVICVSDNGGILHSYPSNNGPLRGGKGDTYEGGIRVMSVMQWPAAIPAGLVSKANGAAFDIFATILDAVGLPVPKQNGNFAVQGVSLLPHLRSKTQTPLPDRHLFFDLYGDCAVVHGKWKLVGEIENHGGDFARAAAAAEKKQFELYNLDEDIGEKNDLAQRNPEIYADLKQRHVAWLKQFATGVGKTSRRDPDSGLSREERRANKKKKKAL